MKFSPIRTMIIWNLTEIFVGDVHIPTDALPGEVGTGFKYILTRVNALRLRIAVDCVTVVVR